MTQFERDVVRLLKQIRLLLGVLGVVAVFWFAVAIAPEAYEWFMTRRILIVVVLTIAGVLLLAPVAFWLVIRFFERIDSPDIASRETS